MRPAKTTEDVFELLDSVTEALVFGAAVEKRRKEAGKKEEVKKEEITEDEITDESPRKRSRKSSDWLERLRRKGSETPSNVNGSDYRAQKVLSNEIHIVRDAARVVRPGYLRVRNYGLLTGARTSHRGAVTALGFRPRDATSDLAWSVSVDKKMLIYSVAETKKEVLGAVMVEDARIEHATLSSDKERVLCLSDRANIFSIHLETRQLMKLPYIGRRGDQNYFRSILCHNGIACVLDDRGCIYQIDERTNQVVRKYNSGSDTTAMAFLPNGVLLSGDAAGDIYQWDTSAKGRCISRTQLSGSLGISSLVINSNKLIVGDAGGVVTQHKLDAPYTLLKTYSNLTGVANTLFSHPKHNLVVAANNDKNDNVRLLNVEEGYVFQNWPGDKLDCGKITCGAFSESNGWVGLGNSQGVVKLWHFPDYTYSFF
ncbi:hypothetical protein GNI_068860 [Gregarina niphandrodes]|uniref:WD domain, G-beta repeat protein n=1 Tax=Gregarina niphandrodes TaxID=110365 RepID=A0A023B7J0_GRENI|nr:hypothetical protein GNI_068860 [Gregarina niphandrodes]EZG67411.1 hypothetical protein GNI_068860 [Gregarina niphandrodes]|eukprot:XP_011130244.1 hypothetical protein GNI_068860 [Gregarina niphandrodes]